MNSPVQSLKNTLAEGLRENAGWAICVGIVMIVAGVLAATAAFQVRPSLGWGWMLANGIITILLGVMISAQWPLSGAWAAGILVGVHLLSGGAALVATRSAVRKGVGAGL
jgi:uncharacterized membrane protein HdeD (DUF308 family)